MGATSGPTEQAWSTGPGLLESLSRYRVIVALACVIAMAFGFLVSQLLPVRYASTATIIVSIGDVSAEDADRRVAQEASRLTSRAVFAQAARELGDVSTAAELEKTVRVDADPVVGVLEITATSESPESAAAVANQVVVTFQQQQRQAANQQVESAREALNSRGTEIRQRISQLQQRGGGPATRQEIATLQAQLTALEARISEVIADAAIAGSGVDTVEEAIPPTAPSSPKPARNAAIACVLGFCLAMAYAYWRAGVIDRAKFDLSTTLGAPLLAEIPDFGRSSARSNGNPLIDSEAAEAYQFLLSAIEYVLAETEARSILVTSASQGDGKSLTSLHLAKALATQGRDVMLVDSDIRARGLTTLLRAEDSPGLDALAKGEDLSQVIRRYRVSQTVQLPLVPAGQPPGQPTGLLSSEPYRQAIGRIIAGSDLTIIDSAPLLTFADASALAAEVAGIVLVLDARTSHEDVVKVSERLRLIPTPLLGLVLNRMPNERLTRYLYGPAEHAPSRSRRRLARLFRGGPVVENTAR